MTSWPPNSPFPKYYHIGSKDFTYEFKGDTTEKTKIMVSSPITSWWIEVDKVEAVTYFLFLDFKITVEVIAAMKLKDTCSLEGKLWQT